MARPTPEKLQLLAKLLKEKGIERSDRQRIPRFAEGGGGEKPPLSFNQRRLWFLDQLEPGTSLYNDCVTLRLTGTEIDEAVFFDAVREVVRRHEVLRSVFLDGGDGEPVVQVEDELGELPIRSVDLRREADAEARVEALLLEDVRGPFELDRLPLIRGSLLRLADDVYEFGLTMHHIVSDGASYGILYDEVGELYAARTEGRAPRLEALDVQYADYAAWERDTRSEESIQAGLDFWRAKLAAPLPVLSLVDGVGRPESSRKGALHRFQIPDALHRSIGEFCRSEQVTSYWVYLASYVALLHVLGGQEDLIVGTPSSCRGRVELERLIGFFVNTVLLRNDVSGDPSFRELLQRTRAVALDAQGHEDVPFERIVQEVRAREPERKAPLIQAWFAHLRDMIPALQLPGGSATYRVFDGKNARFDLCLILDETEGGVQAYFEYDTELISPKAIERITAKLLEVIRHGTRHPESRLSLLRDHLKHLGSGEEGGKRSGALKKLRRSKRKAS